MGLEESSGIGWIREGRPEQSGVRLVQRIFRTGLSGFWRGLWGG